MRKPLDAVAISPEPGAVTALRCGCKVLPANDFRDSANGFVSIQPGTLIYEPPVVY